MNLSHLLLLSVLERHGARHGHWIRRAAEQADVAAWGGVKVGALYRELRQLDAEGLVTAVRTETEGRRPERTIYEITAEGRRRLAMQREEAIAKPRQGPDAVAVALLFGGLGEDGIALTLLRTRREALQREVEGIAAECAHHVAQHRLGAVDVAVFRRGELMRAAEVAWIDETLAALAKVSRRGSKGAVTKSKSRKSLRRRGRE